MREFFWFCFSFKFKMHFFITVWFFYCSVDLFCRLQSVWSLIWNRWFCSIILFYRFEENVILALQMLIASTLNKIAKNLSLIRKHRKKSMDSMWSTCFFVDFFFWCYWIILCNMWHLLIKNASIFLPFLIFSFLIFILFNFHSILRVRPNFSSVNEFMTNDIVKRQRETTKWVFLTQIIQLKLNLFS